MKELLAALPKTVALVMARDAGAVSEARKAALSAETVLIVLDETVPKLDAAMLTAALGPLAIEFAPATRIAALEIAAGAVAADVVAAALFLASAASTTGQILRIVPR